MNIRPRLIVALSAVSLAPALVACGPSPSPASSPSPVSSPSSLAPAVPSSPASSAVPASEPSSTVSDYKVTFGFGVPSGTISIAHPFTPPPLRTLVAIYVGNHPDESPAYQRMSFYFRGGLPSYRIGYVPSVVSDAQGAPIPLPGNAFLRIVFTDAQAHNDSGGSSVVAAPPSSIGYQNLKGYAPAGDFEGHVTYGLGLQVAPNSDQVLALRVGELKKSDGPYYVVFVDIKTA
jgi:hypothetical protein